MDQHVMYIFSFAFAFVSLTFSKSNLCFLLNTTFKYFGPTHSHVLKQIKQNKHKSAHSRYDEGASYNQPFALKSILLSA